MHRDVIVIGGMFPVYWALDSTGIHNFLGKRGLIAYVTKRRLLGDIEIRDDKHILWRR